jgi:hypothetical protein
MNRSLAAATALFAVALAGCSDDGAGDEPEITTVYCESIGLILGEHEVMTGEGDAMEPHMEPACVDPGPPATVTVEGVPASVQAYTPVTVTWVLHTSFAEAHAMRTDVRFDTQANVGAECTPQDELQMPDAWGMELGKAEHQNFEDGKGYTATWTPTEPGMYCLRGYALVSQTNIWSEPVTVDVTPVQATGVTHDVSIEPFGPLGDLSPAAITIGLGDAVVWTDNDPVDSFAIASSSGPASFTTTPGTAVVFVIPGSYAYTATGTFGTHMGQVAVTAPTGTAA